MDIRCSTCGKQLQIMKRCTRCKSVMYCSRECQIKDWPTHQIVCKLDQNGRSTLPQKVSMKDMYDKNDNSIFSDESVSNSHTSRECASLGVCHPPLVDFSKAKKNKTETPINSMKKPDGKCYLFINEYYTDVPVVNQSEPKSSIIVKCNREKYTFDVQNSWTGVKIYKFLSCELSIPLEKVKVIHKGKVLSRETVCETLKNKAVYQVIGEVADSEEDLDQRDISVMMKQMGLDRKAAVQALKKKGDLIDALLDQ